MVIPRFSEVDIEAVTAGLRSDWLMTGPRVAESEEAIRRTVGPPAVAVSSGTADASKTFSRTLPRGADVEAVSAHALARLDLKAVGYHPTQVTSHAYARCEQ